MKNGEKDEVEEDVGKDSAAGKILNKVKRKSTGKQRKREMEGGGLNHNRLLSFTRSRFTKDPRAGPASPTLPHAFNKVMASGLQCALDTEAH